MPSDVPCATHFHMLSYGSMLGRLWMPYLILIVVLAISLAVSIYVSTAARRTDTTRFETQVLRLHNAIDDRLETCIQMLLGAKGLFAASNTVERSECQKYVASQDLSDGYPGIQGVGYAQRVFPRDLDGLIHTVRSQNPNFAITPAGSLEDYFPIL